ncbi:MAG: hypothetical protein GON13_01290 [Nanoarchaeota archaeon]|nr:hypothetical protein [Nanoarchaeota archaeon]
MFLPDRKFFLREIFLISVSVLSGAMAAFFMNVLYDANLFLAPFSTIIISMILSLFWAIITIILLYLAQFIYEKYEIKLKEFIEKILKIGKEEEEGKIAGSGQGTEKKP